MADEPKAPSAQLSRRFLLQSAVTVGGAAVLCTAVTRPASAKATQKAVGYQDTPKGEQRCDNCSQFEAPSSCKVVEGNVSPAGWCKVYVKKKAG